MKPLSNGCFRSHRAEPFRVLRTPEDDLADEVRYIRSLADVWVRSRDGVRPNARSVRVNERKLHDAIKASPFFGKILGFAGLNLWVDEQTMDGLVMSQEGINL
jgi:hypothetical protein